jgi:hypothetical protein
MIAPSRQAVKLALASSKGFGEHVIRAVSLGAEIDSEQGRLPLRLSRIFASVVWPDPMAWAVRLSLGLLALPCCAAPAWAHAAERGFVLLLPTGYYIVGGTLAVAASFLIFLIVPNPTVRRIVSARVQLCRVPRVPKAATSGVAFALLIWLVLAGLFGSRDPLENPLPLTVWTLWWGGITVTHALFGNLWALINPWIAPYRLLRRLGGRSGTAHLHLLPYPAWLGTWPATSGFLTFAWFELVDPAPDDPARLAVAVATYSATTLVGMLLFGEQAWLSKAESFSVFFGFVARLSPLRFESAEPTREPARSDRLSLSLAFPGSSLAKSEALPIGGMVFVLLTLAAVSFDGLSKTFWWLDLGGIDPLEFPGRTAVMSRNSLGLILTWAALVVAYSLAIALGGWLAGERTTLKAPLGAFVFSILPISIGYHFAHYLTAFMVNAQYAVLATGDPFGRGWDLLGLGHREAMVSFLSNYDAVSMIWKLQVAGVVSGHVLAVFIAHIVAVERFATARAARVSQLPLATLMIAYTLFGLWLLATPTAG